jgi:hypothetical protein
MNCEELIEKLKKYPPYFEVQIFHDGQAESEDLHADIFDTEIFGAEKIVNIEITPLLPDGTKKRLR